MQPLRIAALLGLFTAVGSGTAFADQVTVTNQPVYVTKSDCARLLSTHSASADVAYQPGQDVHGKYVPPADLPGNQIPGLVPDKIEFNLQINPMNYSAGAKAAANSTGTSTTQHRFDNTSLPVAHVSVDLASGRTMINGQPLTSEQDRIVEDACRGKSVK